MGGDQHAWCCFRLLCFGQVPNVNSKVFKVLVYACLGTRDNAYINSWYMCMPWRNVSRGAKDAMNFFHLQLRINIECTFGILVYRWGIMRKPMPVNLTVGKTSSLVLALCKLHNLFCIDKSEDVY